MGRGWVAFSFMLPLLPLALARADDAATAQRLAALASQLKSPDGFRAVYKLVDAGPPAIPILLSKLGDGSLSDERIELCLRELARTKEGARSEIEKLGIALQPLTRARLARALAAAGAQDAIYPLVEALDTEQEPLEVVVYAPQGSRPLDTTKIAKPVTQACAAFGEKAASAIRHRLPKARSSLFRIEAAAVLGIVKSVPSAGDLVALANDETKTAEERVAALGALAAIKTPLGRPCFAAAVASEDEQLRAAGARGLTAVPDPSALPALARLLDEDKNDAVRLAAVRALAALEDPLAGPPLKAALEAAAGAGESSRGTLLAACIQGIGASGDRSAIGDLVHVLERGFGFATDRAAAQALSRIPALEYEPRDRLRALASDEKFAAIPRACACWVLALRGEDDALAGLLGLAKHKDWPVRTACAELLAEGKLDGAIPALEALCADPSERVRRAAVSALGRSEASIAGAALVRAARHLDPDPVVRKLYAGAFLDALEQGTLDQGNQVAGRALVAAALEKDMQDATLPERRAQAKTLARLGDRAALLRLATAALTTGELPADSRRAAIEALTPYGANEAVESALVSLVKDAALGDDAAVALARIHNETFFEPAWRQRLAPAAPYR
jgi:HEAT repeat protein